MKEMESTRSKGMRKPIAVGIIGDFDPDSSYHRATNQAIMDAAGFLSESVTYTWLPTPSLTAGADSTLQQFDALWCSPGSPYVSMEGALKGIQFARERDWPFLGT